MLHTEVLKIRHIINFFAGNQPTHKIKVKQKKTKITTKGLTIDQQQSNQLNKHNYKETVRSHLSLSKKYQTPRKGGKRTNQTINCHKKLKIETFQLSHM